MANTSLLKKGTPPAREKAESVIEADPRRHDGKNRPLQVMVPPAVFDAFSARAGQEFGFSKGAKSHLFMAMWEAYKSMKH